MKIHYTKIRKLLKKVEQELQDVLSKVSETKTKKFIGMLTNANATFLTGQGRSGLIAEAFAMRLMQLGFKSYVVGLPTTPAIGKNDLLVAISGTGKTRLTLDIIKEAKKAKAKICLITANKNSEAAKLSNLVIEIKAKTKLDHKKSIEPLGSLFEQAAFLYLDSVVILLMEKLKISEKTLKRKHASLE